MNRSSAISPSQASFREADRLVGGEETVKTPRRFPLSVSDGRRAARRRLAPECTGLPVSANHIWDRDTTGYPKRVRNERLGHVRRCDGKNSRPVTWPRLALTQLRPKRRPPVRVDGCWFSGTGCSRLSWSDRLTPGAVLAAAAQQLCQSMPMTYRAQQLAESHRQPDSSQA